MGGRKFGSLPDGVIWNGEYREKMAGFHYADLNAVMDAGREWCDAHNAVVESSCAKGSILARVRFIGGDGEPPWQHCDTLQEALLTACV